MKLDIKDRKILYELDLNCRQSFQSIGKKVRLSKESVFYRIRKLEDSGVVRHYSTMVDVGKMGYTNFRIFLKFQNTTPSKEQEIVDYLEKERVVGWFVTIEGNWDLNVWILCKTVGALDAFWEKFKGKYINYIAKHELSVFTNITYFSKSYLIDKKNEHSFRFVGPSSEEKLDATDLDILGLMALNARIPVIEIADRLKISPRTIANRIKNLERRKIIVGHKPLLDLDKLGYLYYKIHLKLHNLTGESLREFNYYIFQHPNMVYVNFAIGGPDLEIDMQVENTEKLRGIVNEMKGKFYGIIQDYEIMHYLKEYKYLLLPVES